MSLLIYFLEKLISKYIINCFLDITIFFNNGKVPAFPLNSSKLRKVSFYARLYFSFVYFNCGCFNLSSNLHYHLKYCISYLFFSSFSNISDIRNVIKLIFIWNVARYPMNHQITASSLSFFMRYFSIFFKLENYKLTQKLFLQKCRLLAFR